MDLKVSKGKVTLLVVLGILVAIPFVWDHHYPSGSWSYGVTITVETPDGEVVGKVVRKRWVSRGPTFGVTSALPSSRTKGEAVVIDMGQRGVLFALVSELDISQVFPLPPEKKGKGIEYYRSLGNAKVVLPENLYPRLVRFKDMNDPKSVELVPSDDLAKVFGDGVTLQSIIVEMTDESVTWGEIDQYLPWLTGLEGKYLGGGTTTRSAPHGLHGGNFKMNN